MVWTWIAIFSFSCKEKFIEKYQGKILFLFEISSKSKKVENWRSVISRILFLFGGQESQKFYFKPLIFHAAIITTLTLVILSLFAQSFLCKVNTDTKQCVRVWSADQNAYPLESSEEKVWESGLSLHCQVNYMLSVNSIVQVTSVSKQSIFFNEFAF